MNIKHRQIFFIAAATLVVFLIGSALSVGTEVNSCPQDRPTDDIAFEASQTAKAKQPRRFGSNLQKSVAR